MISAKYLIIGNSIAAINAIEGIREMDRKGSIILISDEPSHVYSRPLISYYLAERIHEDSMSYRTLSFYDDHQVRTYLGRRAVGLNASDKRVILDDQTEIGFEKLLLATGGVPFIPEIQGSSLQGVFTFTTLEDAKNLKEFIKLHKVRRAVVLGGGLIGLKAAEALISLKIQTIIIELADRLLSATFDQTASMIIEHALNHIGCAIMKQNTVKAFIEGKDGRIGSVLLEDDSRILCDLVIIAIGVQPRIDFVQGTGIEINKGILVDDSLQTSVKSIYAAGDVVECYDYIINKNRPMAILPNASRQGRIAGHNMAGGKREYKGSLAMNSIEIAHIPTVSVGLTDPTLITDPERQKRIEVLQYVREKENIYQKIIIEGNRIIGVILIGKIDRAGIYTGLIKDKTDISSVKDHLLKEDFGLLSLPKAYRKHLVTGQGIEV
ncbi:MAG: NAD(P)/FAD-dependent oxidoreductase [bacterium]